MSGWLVVEDKKSDIMKDLESVFKQEMQNKYEMKEKDVTDEPPNPPKTQKKSIAEQFKVAAIGCKKITEWTVISKRKKDEWDDDPDLPELEEIEVVLQLRICQQVPHIYIYI